MLPVASLGLVYLALYLRLMRDGMADAWAQDFARGAIARGIPRRRLVLRHIARNALLPVVTMLGLQSASMLGGSVVVESVFAIPGLGRLASEAVARRDMPLLLGVVLLSARGGDRRSTSWSTSPMRGSTRASAAVGPNA